MYIAALYMTMLGMSRTGKDEGSLLDHFELELTVTDSNGAWEKDYLTVYEDESAWVCIN